MSQFGRQTVDDWRLDFRLPGGQRADAAARDWSQTGDTVTSLAAAAAARPLPPGRSATLRFTGVHDGTNPLPMVFHLATRTHPEALPCAATILGSQSTRDDEASRGESSTEDSADDGRGKGRKGKGRSVH